MTVPGLCFVCAGSLLVNASLAAPRSVGAVGGCIPGSYLAAEGSGTQSLLTFSSDGTFHLASSAERAFGFSHIQGTWQRQGAHVCTRRWSRFWPPVGPDRRRRAARVDHAH